MLIERQLIWFKIRFNRAGKVSDDDHPYLVYKINRKKNKVTLIQIDHLDNENERYKMTHYGNVKIELTDGNEDLLDKDSYAQTDNEFSIDLFDELEIFRKKPGLISEKAYYEIDKRYNMIRKDFDIKKCKKVHITKEEFIELNKDKLSA